MVIHLLEYVCLCLFQSIFCDKGVGRGEGVGKGEGGESDPKKIYSVKLLQPKRYVKISLLL